MLSTDKVMDAICAVRGNSATTRTGEVTVWLPAGEIIVTSCAKTRVDASKDSDIANTRNDFRDIKTASCFLVSVQDTHSYSVRQGYLGTFFAKSRENY